MVRDVCSGRARGGVVAVAIFLGTAFPGSAAIEQNEHAHVLILHSYHDGFPWTDHIMEGVQEVFDAADEEIDLVVEYMDTQRFRPDTLAPQLQGLYHRKYQHSRFDVVMVSDNEALDFVLDHRAQLFPGTPIVFCGIENITHIPLGGQPDVTGIAEAIDIRATLDLALSLHPDTKTIGIIHDDTEAGRIDHDRLQRLRVDYEAHVSFEDLSPLSLMEMHSEMQTAGPDTLFLLLHYNHDETIHAHSVDQAIPLLTSATERPVYAFWENHLEYGALGGVVISGRTQGKEAALIALKILRGESATKIPIRTRSPNVPMFQFDKLRGAGLSVRDLPPGTVVLNQPPSLYTKHHKLILVVAGIVAMITGGVITLYLNVLRRRRAEKSAHESEQRYLSLFETSRDGIVLVDMNDHITDANSAFLAMTGHTRRELDAMKYADFTAEDPNPSGAGEFPTEMMGRGLSPELEQSFRRKDGTKVPVSVKGASLRDANQKPTGIWWIVRDITARKKTEEALRSSEEQLRHSQKLEAVGRLAGGVAHDFNNLLTSILGYSMLALETVPPDEELYSDLEQVVSAAERAKALTAQLLTFGQKNVTDIRPLDINAVVLGMDGLLRRTLGEDIELVTALHEAPGIVRADSGQLEQIVMNLSVNARDAMPGGGCLRIETAPTNLDGEFTRTHPGMVAGRFVMLRVSDTGTGIPPEVREHVFEPFFSTKAKDKGTGLGLATVYGIVRQYGGTIDLETEADQGTTFTCYFPATEEPSDALRVIIEDEVPEGTETILLVEDQHAVLQLTSRLLREAGFSVLACGHAQDALGMADSHTGPIDLVLTDVIMPKMNGPELVRQLVDKRHDFKVLYMSGFTDVPLEEATANGEGYHLIKKPFTRRDLLWKVRGVLDDTDRPSRG